MQLIIRKTFLGPRQVWFIDDHGDGTLNGYKLAKEMQLTSENYKAVMLNQFNAYYPAYSSGLYFKTEQDAKDALAWIEERIVLVRLGGI